MPTLFDILKVAAIIAVYGGICLAITAYNNRETQYVQAIEIRKETNKSCGYATVVIDGYEYIRLGHALSHKGNCSNCERKRNETSH